MKKVVCTTRESRRRPNGSAPWEWRTIAITLQSDGGPIIKEHDAIHVPGLEGIRLSAR